MPVLDDGKGRLLLADVDGNVSVSTDEGDTWRYLPSSGLPYGTVYGSPLGMDGTGRLVVIELISGNAGGGRALVLYTSTDDGATWRPSPAQIPNPNVSAFVTDKAGRLLAATTGGVYRLQ